MILTVTVPDQRTFDAYYYGGADEVQFEFVQVGVYRPPSLRYTLVYSDSYLAQCQEARFASGLYFTRFSGEG